MKLDTQQQICLNAVETILGSFRQSLAHVKSNAGRNLATDVIEHSNVAVSNLHELADARHADRLTAIQNCFIDTIYLYYLGDDPQHNSGIEILEDLLCAADIHASAALQSLTTDENRYPAHILGTVDLNSRIEKLRDLRISFTELYNSNVAGAGSLTELKVMQLQSQILSDEDLLQPEQIALWALLEDLTYAVNEDPKSELYPAVHEACRVILTTFDDLVDSLNNARKTR